MNTWNKILLTQKAWEHWPQEYLHQWEENSFLQGNRAATNVLFGLTWHILSVGWPLRSRCEWFVVSSLTQLRSPTDLCFYWTKKLSFEKICLATLDTWTDVRSVTLGSELCNPMHLHNTCLLWSHSKQRHVDVSWSCKFTHHSYCFCTSHMA